MKVKILNKSAYPAPAYATELSAGMDLKADIQEPVILAPLKRAMIPTGLSIALPAGFEAQVRPRSGLAAKHGITVLNTPGTIDADYRGEIKVILVNLSDEAFTINPGERIAQMVIARHEHVEWEEVEALDETSRGKGGFGSIPHTASVSMTIPIFSGLQRKSQLKQEQITLEQTQITRSLLEDNLQLQEEQYKFNLRNALENYNLQKENITVAKKVLESYQNKYNVGTISSLDLTQANNNYLEAENNYTSACLTLLEAQTQLLKLYNELK